MLQHRGHPRIVLLGDSLLSSWPTAGRDSWARDMAPRGVADFALSGDSTRQILYRLEAGLLDGLAPELVILMVGVNNLYSNRDGGTDLEIAEGIRECARQIRRRCPEARVLLLGILPQRDRTRAARAAHINSLTGARALIASYDARLFQRDGLHLGPAGYVALAEGLARAIESQDQ